MENLIFVIKELIQMLIELLKIFTSPQIIILTICIIFKKNISKLIDRIRKIKAGSTEISTPQQEKMLKDEELIRSTETQSILKEKKVEKTPYSQKEFIKLQSELIAEKTNALEWEFRYLNYFLVPHTQRVLDWINQFQQGTTLSRYQTHWMQIIITPNERQAVIEALQTHNLIEIENDSLIKTTEKGKSYINWRISI